MTDASASATIRPKPQGDFVTPAEMKTLEGQRIMAAMAALGALPAAALVAAKAPVGAPLFCLAIVAVLAGYVFWINTDGIYAASTYGKRLSADLRAEMLRVGTGYSYSVLGYCAVSMLATFGGFAAQFSKLRAPMTIEDGFLLAGALSIVGLLHVVWSVIKLNELRTKTRAELAN